MNTQGVTVLENKKTGETINVREITNSKGEKRNVASIMVTSKEFVTNGSIGRMAVRTAFATVEEDVVKHFGADAFKDEATFPMEGKIIIEETLTPWKNSKGKMQEPKINPETKKTITYQGKPVYRNQLFVSDINRQDIYLNDKTTAPVVVEAEKNDATI
jgi:hypothetical protein